MQQRCPSSARRTHTDGATRHSPHRCSGITARAAGVLATFLSLAGAPAVGQAPASAGAATAHTGRISFSLNGDMVAVRFEVPGAAVPSAWHGDSAGDASSEAPPYVARLLRSAEEIVTLYPGSLCHQESSNVRVLAPAADGARLQDVGRDFPPAPGADEVVKLEYEYHCDAIDREALRWVDVNAFKMFPALEKLALAARVDGRRRTDAPAMLDRHAFRLQLMPVRRAPAKTPANAEGAMHRR